MSLPDLNTEEGRAAYRKELRGVALPIRLAGFLLIVAGGAVALMVRFGVLGLDNSVMPVCYAALGFGWALFLAAIVIRTRYHKRRLAEGL